MSFPSGNYYGNVIVEERAYLPQRRQEQDEDLGRSVSRPYFWHNALGIK